MDYKLRSFLVIPYHIRLPMAVFIAVDGYTLPCAFVVKELCIMFSGGEYNHFLLKPPVNQHLTDVDKRTICFTTRHLNNLHYNDGDTPYENLHQILSKYSEYWVYTYSEPAVKLLQRALPTSVITNIQDLGFKMPKMLPNPACCRVHNPRYCAMAKAIAVKNYLELRG